MAVTPNVINKIKKVEYSTSEPSDKGVLWAEPAEEGQHTYRVYDNGQWNIVSSGGSVPTNISYFVNDVGYITMGDLPSDLYEIPETGIPSTDLSSAVQTSLGKADTAIQEHQDISGKEDKTEIVTVSGSSLTAEADKYYVGTSVGTLAITLPALTGSYTQSILFYLETGTNPNVTFSSSNPIIYTENFEIEGSSVYEVSALWNGIKWVVGLLKLASS